MHTSSVNTRIWAIVPASGTGSRMALDFPKQYLTLLDKTVLEHTLHKLDQIEYLDGIVIVISDSDTHFEHINLNHYRNIHFTYGGRTRAQSVYNGLNFVKKHVSKDSSKDSLQPIWALVHDCARPCVQVNAIEKLIHACVSKNIGGILANKVADTVKLANTTEPPLVDQTQDRSMLWLAQTPQFFLLDELISALTFCRETKTTVTDEASAMEKHNKSVQLIESGRDNIKITTADDIAIATAILANQQKVNNGI